MRVGVDTGGTFTDLVAFDESDGVVRVGKAPSTPADPAQAVFDAFAAAGVAPGGADAIVLGTTIATNALLQRDGAHVVFVTTAGFRDVPIIGRVDKEDPYDLRWRKPQPLVRRASCLEVAERVRFDGSVERALAAAELERLGDGVAHRLEALEPGEEAAIAVCLLFAYANPEHERRLARELRARFPGVPVSVSHVVAPTWREYERASTTIVDAYLKPAVAKLLERLQGGLAERAFRGGLAVVKSNGGQVDAGAAAERSAELVLSGLAGGIVAGRYYGELAGVRDLITLDMGGTSADVGIVREGEIGHVSELELEFGLPIARPAIDLTTVGAGGGSIAWIDDGGLLRVGPRSAGAVPGPAAYGLGGTEPTVTDANLVLGRLDPAGFLGGRMPLDRAAATRALAGLASQLRLGIEEAAQAVVELATERMAGSIRDVAIGKGADPRDLHLVAFGGAGPLHACGVADALGLRGVIVPPHPGLASAFGALVADVRVDRRSTQYFRSDAIDLDRVNARLDDMVAGALRDLRVEGFRGEPAVLRSISMRYAGQNYETEVPIPTGRLDGAALDALLGAFHERHEEAFGYAFPDETLELVHFNVTVVGARNPPRAPQLQEGEAAAVASRRDVFFGAAGSLPTNVVRREDFPAGAALAGPAIVEEADSTTLVPPDWQAVATAEGLLRLSRAAVAPTSRRRRIDSVSMSMLDDQLVSIAQEMGTHMMRTSYSPIFSESRDFSCALFDARGAMIAQGSFCPAHLGAIVHTVEFMLDEVDPERLEPGDVLLHNDPFRGGCHMPEHTLLRPIFHDGRLVAFAAAIGHLAEIGASTVGSFASTATEVFQEGLRLPPVTLMRRDEPVGDVWKIILANHRTPRHTWGDLHAMIGALRAAEARFVALLDKYGAAFVLEVCDELIRYSERLTRATIAGIPDGVYAFEDGMEDDGTGGGPVAIRVCVTVDGERLLVDYTGSDPQARGPINATYGVTTSATYNALFQLAGAGVPRNAGAHRCTKTIAPPGSVVNVAFPGPSVGGNTETQPKLVGMILGALAAAVPERVMAAEGVTSCNFLFGGIHPLTGEYYAHYHFEASGWGGRSDGDGNSAQNHIHGNCRNTPVEVFETRFPFVTERYELVPDSGGAGRRRGGLATRRVLRVSAPSVTVSAMMDRVENGAWGLFGGESGRCADIRLRRAGDTVFRPFTEACGTLSRSKFADVLLRRGDAVLIESAGGGGFGPPGEREREHVYEDLEEGLVTEAAARQRYGLTLATIEEER